MYSYEPYLGSEFVLMLEADHSKIRMVLYLEKNLSKSWLKINLSSDEKKRYITLKEGIAKKETLPFDTLSMSREVLSSIFVDICVTEMGIYSIS